jgi:crotonobetainyl-CoA:carnitine CoA-transferase CaiB-like acyl-CoA transferase
MRRDRQPQGNRSFTAAPVDTFKTRSGWITVQVVGNRNFKRWCEVVGHPELSGDPRFATDRLRGMHGEEISAVMAGWCVLHEREQALRLLADARIPAAPVNTLQQALEDPHIGALGLLQDVGFPGLDPAFPMTPHPVDMSSCRPSLRMRPPTLGEHTDEVLGELGYSKGQVAALRDAGSI